MKLKTHLFALGLISAAAFLSPAGAQDFSEADLAPAQLEAAGVECPQYLACPYSIPGYPVFMYAINNCSTAITCWYRSNGYPYQVKSTTMLIPQECPDCCATGYCPNERCGQATYSRSWTCN
jgi:hypothetical protein